MRLTDQDIKDAKNAVNLNNPQHEHNDCIRMAYEWLDAQKTVKTKRADDWKHLVEYWCGRYITKDDIKIAAHLHPRIGREKEKLNISNRLTLPRPERLIGVNEAKKHIEHMNEDKQLRYVRIEV